YRLTTRLLLSTLIHTSLFFNDPPTTDIYTLSLHDALPIFGDALAKAADLLRDLLLVTYEIRNQRRRRRCREQDAERPTQRPAQRSEEHTSELQSPYDLVCRLLLEKKKKQLLFPTRPQCS